ncbi:MAG: hypothetical protein ACRCSB_01995 [Bacteroidales bacterium]
MNIQFCSNDKKCQAFFAYVNNPSDRSALKVFRKCFNKDIAHPANKLYQRLSSAKNAEIYNRLYGGNNKIEKYAGVSINSPTVLKVRLTQAYRKFFYFYAANNEYSLMKDWSSFKDVESIYIYEINNHDYSRA